MEQPVAVEDVGQVTAQAARLGGPSGKFEMGGPDRLSLRETVNHVFDVVGYRRPILPIPKWMALFGATFLQYLPGTPVTPNSIHFITEDFVADNGPLLAAFDIELTSFYHGIRRYMEGEKRKGSLDLDL